MEPPALERPPSLPVTLPPFAVMVPATVSVPETVSLTAPPPVPPVQEPVQPPEPMSVGFVTEPYVAPPVVESLPPRPPYPAPSLLPEGAPVPFCAVTPNDLTVNTPPDWM